MVSINPNIYNIKIDTVLDLKNEHFTVSANDINSHKLNIEVTQNKEPYPLTGLAVNIHFLKSDGKLNEQEVTIDNAIEGKTSCILETNSINSQGRVRAEVLISKDETLLTTKRFEFYATNPLASDKVIESTTELPLLNKLITKVEAMIETQLAMAQAENTRQDNEQLRITLHSELLGLQTILEGLKLELESTNNYVEDNEGMRIVNENNRIDNEVLREALYNDLLELETNLLALNNTTTSLIADTNTAITNTNIATGNANSAATNANNISNAITQAEGLRVTAESLRVTAEGLRVTAENERKTAETNRESNYTTKINEFIAETERVEAIYPTRLTNVEDDLAEHKLNYVAHKEDYTTTKYISEGLFENTLSSKSLQALVPPMVANLDGKLICKSDTDGKFWSHTHNLAFLTEGTVEGYGLTVTVLDGKITINGTSTTWLKIILSTEALIITPTTPVLSDILPYNGSYRIRISPTLGSGCSLNIRTTNATNIGVTQGAISSFSIPNNASYIFIQTGSGTVFTNAVYAVDIVAGGTGFTSLAPKNHLTDIDTTISEYGFIDTNIASIIEFMGGGNQLIYTEKNIEPIDDVNLIVGLDKFDVYVKGTNTESYKYIQYPFKHSVLALNRLIASSNYDIWTIDGAFEVTKGGEFIFSNPYRLVNGGEWELVIFEDGMSDFVGGFYHGDEVLTKTLLLIDGVIQDLTVAKNVKGKKIEFMVWSDLYRDNTKTPVDLIKIATHYKKYTFTKDGLDLEQKVNWLVGLNVKNCYMSMLPIKRKVGNDNTGLQITDRAFTNDYTVYDVAEAGFVTAIRTPTNGRTMFNVHGLTTGYSGVVDMYYKNVSLPNSNGFVSSDNGYNKIYIDFSGITSVLVGDVWECKTRFKLNTIN